MRLAISALVSAPNNVITPARTHTNKSNSGEPSWAAITLDFLKMPEPITPPTTSITVENNPNVGSKPGRDGDWLDSLMRRECGGKRMVRTAPNMSLRLEKHSPQQSLSRVYIE